ncbi:MAG: ABC transporter permease [Bacillota bacterium]|jgi:peptide/nickel transport system permease protein
MPSKILLAIIRRFVKTLLLFAGIALFIFFLVRIVPGDVVELLALESGMTESMKQHLRQELGLNQNVIIQFYIWLQGLIHLDLGNSLRFHRPVLELFLYSLPFTLRFAAISSCVGILLGITVAAGAIIWRNKFGGFLVEALNIWSIAVPTFCAGFIGIYLMVLRLHWMPLTGNLILPVLVLGVDIAGQVVKPFYEEMQETLSARFITIARSKGLSHYRIVIRHVIPNSLTVLLALSGLIVAGTLGGSITMEVLFNMPGLGKLAFDAVSGRDYPVVQVLALFIAFAVLCINFLTDVAAIIIDPRLREGRGIS